MKVNCSMTTHLLVLSSRPAILNRRGSTPVSTVLRKSVRKVASHAGVFRGARISSLPTGREEIRAPLKNACVGGYQERGLKGVRIQNISWGEPPPEPPLEACAFGAHFGNRSVFILDLRLLKSFPKTFPSKWGAQQKKEKTGTMSELKEEGRREKGIKKSRRLCHFHSSPTFAFCVHARLSEADILHLEYRSTLIQSHSFFHFFFHWIN